MLISEFAVVIYCVRTVCNLPTPPSVSLYHCTTVITVIYHYITLPLYDCTTVSLYHRICTVCTAICIHI
jgi:hypothetical protein